jgi:predicted nuclease of predicted toxin-antitoxin system
MWLLDANMPIKLVGVLSDLGIEADSAESRGWKALTNGQLVEAASSVGFVALLTRDRLFGEAAARALKRFPEFGVVLVLIPQLQGPEFLRQFQMEWQRAPIIPQPGRSISWPT